MTCARWLLLNRVKSPRELVFDPHIAAHFPQSRRYLIGVSGGRGCGYFRANTSSSGIGRVGNTASVARSLR